MPPRYSFFIKLMMFTTLVSTIPLLSLGIYSFFQSTSTVQTKVNEANVFILQQSQNRVEQILKVIDQVSGRYAETPFVVNSVAKRMKIEDFQDIELLVRGLLGVQTYELGVKSVELHSLQNEWYIKDGGFYFGTDKGKEAGTFNSVYNSRWMPDMDQTFSGIKLVKPIPSTASEQKGYLSVRVSNTELAKLLTGGFSTRETMIIDDKMNVIIHSNTSRIGQSVLSEPWLKELQNTRNMQGYFNSTLQGKDYSVIYNQSRYNNWTYVSVIPLEEAKKESASIGWATLTACLLLLLFTALLAYWGSRRMSFPVRSLMEFTMRHSKASGSGAAVKDELQWIGTQFASLHQSKEQLEGQMKIQSGQLIDYFMLKLFQGEMHRGELNEKASQYHIPAWHRYAVMVLQIDTLEQTRYNSNEQDLLLFAINNIASELIPQPQRIHAMPIGNYQVTLVGSDVENHRELLSDLSALAESVQKAAAEFLELKVSIGISRPYEHMYATHQAFLEAKEALQYRLRLGEKAILHLDDLKPQQASRHYYPHHLVSELTQAIAFLDRDKAGELLQQFIQEVLRVETDPNLYRMSFAMLLTDLARVIYDMGDTGELFSQDRRNEYEQLFSLKTPQEIEGWFNTQIIHPMIELTRKRHESSGKSISRSVMDLIHEHYDSDLTLEQCALRMNYSTHYIRRMFRKETGLNFSDYLSGYRHDMAKSWLSATEMKITEVAERLQYTNAQNFIRQFRKLEGMTPGQYREQKQKEL
ncbi:helix-turn-helix domain-containing protein [Paenibacillus radicis (ex Xue et al. 2023)]|uniref:Helix-turn-helix domain-containing protein n=1 Tax=Paenibacillus radicis (ex Xue et al. 2023) TaxID=2972489 RepID=A0ABT1YTH4_9BACL|nr:helix-turn-helix domain-containing protein [Paenibacillus radicis (ex Xue et al. 2023)]MCR8636481.1 helix-turn-helix domain-containing protein [Paenibacillus radicis (ex Xue et al. 2023)]